MFTRLMAVVAGPQSNLGFMSYDGEGIPQDYAEAVKWHRKAAAQGNVPVHHDSVIPPWQKTWWFQQVGRCNTGNLPTWWWQWIEGPGRLATNAPLRQGLSVPMNNPNTRIKVRLIAPLPHGTLKRTIHCHYNSIVIRDGRYATKATSLCGGKYYGQDGSPGDLWSRPLSWPMKRSQNRTDFMKRNEERRPKLGRRSAHL